MHKVILLSNCFEHVKLYIRWSKLWKIKKMIRAVILQNEGVFLTKVISLYLTRKGSEKYPIPANKSTTISFVQSSRDIRSFSERFPDENMHFVASKEYVIPFSRWLTQLLSPTNISRVLSLVPVDETRPWYLRVHLEKSQLCI